MKTYQTLAKACGAYHRCVASNNTEWQAKWKNQIDGIVDGFPSGSGFDRGTSIDLDQSNDEKLVFETSFHHMNDGGMYDGWTEHTVTVLPSLGLDYHLKVILESQSRSPIPSVISIRDAISYLRQV